MPHAQRHSRLLLCASVVGAFFVACATGGNNSGTVNGDDDSGVTEDAGKTDTGKKDSGKDTGGGGDDTGTGDDSGGPIDSGNPGFDAGPCTAVNVSSLPSHGGSACAGSGCYPHSAAAYSPAWTPPLGAKLGKCTSAQVDGYYTNCLGPNATQSTCTTWQGNSSNKTCEGCLATPHTASQWGALVEYSGIVSVNVSGCIALAEPCNLPCAQAIQANEGCYNYACDTSSWCPVTDQTSFTAWQTCIQNSESCAACSGFNAPAQCQTLLTGSSHSAETLCNLQAASFQSYYTSVANFICGQ